ncbi:DUF411 domain-containing protein [Halofilum ochraceum]|uniref:DUF411 domain-containing protein n=1 Tax=Halofilum ochraceum TaxID=1611323 RepID=UPI0008327ADA|nr:DUF411 domain-containing protein [Halofilum ochraceum]
MNRFWKTLFGAALFVPSLAAANAINVYKTATCGCCAEWVRHMDQAGFEMEVHEVERSGLLERKRALRVQQRLSSCHTATVSGYVVEGHVPAVDVRRLLAERPPIAGIAVPGMPAGSPGMEYGQQSEPYNVVAFDEAGGLQVFARH